MDNTIRKNKKKTQIEVVWRDFGGDGNDDKNRAAAAAPHKKKYVAAKTNSHMSLAHSTIAPFIEI